MYKLKYIILFLTIALTANANQIENISDIDSLSYEYFLNGNWKKLIDLGKKANKEGVDFKYLQQRMGYAYYMLGDYYNSIRYYKNSLRFDKNDQISHTYLYYSAIRIANESMARYHLSKLKEENRKYPDAKKYKLPDFVDLEYNYKINNYVFRGNPQYKRIGINIQPGYRLNLYQSVSTFSQITELTDQTIQNEYFASLNYTVFSGANLNVAYHYVGLKYSASTDTLNIAGNLLFAKLSQNWRRFDFSLSQSAFKNDYNNTSQSGVQIGYSLPTKFRIYVKSSLYLMNESDSTRLIFNQTAGAMIGKRCWLQGSLTLGNLNNFADNDGLYLYNSIDYTTFRVGGSAFFYWGRHLTLFTNYTFDKKQTIETLYQYNQHSISGGLIWKI